MEGVDRWADGERGVKVFHHEGSLSKSKFPKVLPIWRELYLVQKKVSQQL